MIEKLLLFFWVFLDFLKDPVLCFCCYDIWMLKDLFKGDILLFLLRVFLLVVCLACSFDVFFVKDGSLVMENLFKFMSWVKIYSLFTHFFDLF